MNQEAPLLHMGRESIFSSAIRSFCIALCAVLGLVAAFFVVTLAIGSFGGSGKLTGTYDYELMPDERGNREALAPHAPAILWLNVDGVIGAEKFTTDDLQALLVESREGDFSGDRIKAVLLHINSPGGSAEDSENIYHAIKEYKERYKVPVYAYVDGLCASGGMMIACAADKIYATSASIVGSVGVISRYFNVADFLDKLGVKSLVLSEGKGKGALNMFRPWQPGEEKNIVTIMDALYENFTNIVSGARPRLTKQLLIGEYGAEVFIAPTALELGYIDEIASTASTPLRDVAQAAGIAGSYQVVALSPSRWLGGLVRADSPLLTGKVQHDLHLPPGLDLALWDRYLYLYTPAP